MDVIFDLDGTLANIEHRLCYINSKPKNYKAFHKECVNDSPIWSIIEIARTLKRDGHRIIICSGRSDEVEAETRDWLSFVDVEFDGLYMRPAGDYRKDSELKALMLQEIYKDGFDPILVFDDRQQVVDMWRYHGLKCCQVAEGDF